MNNEFQVQMPLWAKLFWLVSVIITALVFYWLINGNRAVMILLGCAISFIGVALWQAFQFYKGNIT